jgi:hypothetical protein
VFALQQFHEVAFTVFQLGLDRLGGYLFYLFVDLFHVVFGNFAFGCGEVLFLHLQDLCGGGVGLLFLFGLDFLHAFFYVEFAGYAGRYTRRFYSLGF